MLAALRKHTTPFQSMLTNGTSKIVDILKTFNEADRIELDPGMTPYLTARKIVPDIAEVVDDADDTELSAEINAVEVFSMSGE